MLHATLIGPGLTLGVGVGGVECVGGVFSRSLVFWDVRAEVRKVEEEVRGGEVEGWRMWRPGVSLIIMDALLDESSQDMFA